METITQEQLHQLPYPLACDCENQDAHEAYADNNGEVVLECTECKRFVKYPHEFVATLGLE